MRQCHGIFQHSLILTKRHLSRSDRFPVLPVELVHGQLHDWGHERAIVRYELGIVDGGAAEGARSLGRVGEGDVLDLLLELVSHLDAAGRHLEREEGALLDHDVALGELEHHVLLDADVKNFLQELYPLWVA